MATRLRKVRRMRGSRTHGWGTSGQHRKGGMRGGHGLAGRVERMASMLRRGRVRGKLGFKAPHRSIRRVLNVGQLQFVARGLAPEAVEKAQGPIEIDLTKLGVRKLLGSGIVEGPFLVKVDSCSSSARRKIEEAGGKVLMPQPSTKG